MTIIVVNFKDVKKHWSRQTRQFDNADYIYIGRRNPLYNLPDSPYRNPFPIRTNAPRAVVLERYRLHLLAHPELLAQARQELPGKTLVCWCAPHNRCHGDILRELIESADV